MYISMQGMKRDEGKEEIFKSKTNMWNVKYDGYRLTFIIERNAI